MVRPYPLENAVMTVRTFSSLLLTTAATLALAGCQKPADAPVDNAASNAGNSVGSVETIGEPDANIAPPANSVSPAINEIPTAFLGRWGMVPNDCDVSRSDTKGLVTVTPDALKFYESMGRLESIEGVSPTEVKATFAFTGEGQSWTKTMTLALDEGGTTLVRTEQDPAGTFRHQKCG